MSRWLLPIALLLVLAPSASALLAPGGEMPRNVRCDTSGRLVCAGIDVGANANCDIDRSGNVACDWSYGWIAAGWSPIGLPGAESHDVRVTVDACSSRTGCQRLTDVATRVDCAWTPADACVDGPGFFPPGITRQLALGECLTISVRLEAAIFARVPETGPALASAQAAALGDNGAAACHVDDGRGA